MTAVILARQLLPQVAALPPQEASPALRFITDFEANPANPGFQLHPVTHTRARGLWSARISRDLRAILHKDAGTWVILYIDHHDPAYAWAERRTVSRNDTTGDLQIVAHDEVVKTRTRIIERAVEMEPRRFGHHKDDYLLSLGVPLEWLPVIRELRSDDDVLEVCVQLSPAVAERLMSLANGVLITPPAPVPATTPLADTPDVRRHYFIPSSPDELQRVLAAPLDAWIAFLHPTQASLATRTFSGPAKVSGSAGTGKTVVAMHRARHLARAGERVLLTSFVTTLCENLRLQLTRLCSPEELTRITVTNIHKAALDLAIPPRGRLHIAPDKVVRDLLEAMRKTHAPQFDKRFVRAEFEHVIQRQGVTSWPEYRSARRTGRGVGLGTRERKALWQVFGAVYDRLRETHKADWSLLCRLATDRLTTGQVTSPFSAVIVDELQDLKPPELRFLKALAAAHPENLMLVGDAGQRVYPGGFSLRGLGIDVVGRASVLRINYRTTEQIRRASDRVLGAAADDMDGGTESRTDTRSLLSGAEPVLRGFPSLEAERDAAVAQVREWCDGGLADTEIALFARTKKLLNGLAPALVAAGFPVCLLSKETRPDAPGVRLGTMHRAKGLEFKAVLVYEAADDTLPYPAATRGLDDPQDREDALAQEQRLLYVAMTRARDRLVVTWAGKPSRFLAPVTAAAETP